MAHKVIASRVARTAMGALLSLAAHAPAFAQTGRPFAAVEDLRIRGADHDISSYYGSKFFVFPDGTMALFDETNGQFMLFNTAGSKTAAFGRKGSGPGEFAASGGGTIRSPSGVSRPAPPSYPITFGLTGDTAWVYHREQRRFTLFTKDAKLVRTAVLPALDPKSLIGFTPVSYMTRGSILGELVTGTSVPYTDNDGDRKQFFTPNDSAVVVISPAGTVERRVVGLPLNSQWVTVARPGMWSTSAVPFEVGALRDVSRSGDRVLFVTHQATSPTGGTYSVLVIGARGDTLVSKTSPYTAAAISPRQLDSAYAAKEKSLRSSTGRDPTVTDELLKGIRAGMPRVESPFQAAMIGRDGSIWLRGVSRTEMRFTVLDERGNHIGDVTLPNTGRPTIKEVSKDAVWVTMSDADGFTDVVRYRVVFPGARR